MPPQHFGRQHGATELVCILILYVFVCINACALVRNVQLTASQHNYGVYYQRTLFIKLKLFITYIHTYVSCVFVYVFVYVLLKCGVIATTFLVTTLLLFFLVI